MLFIAAVQALLLFGFTTASPVAQASSTSTMSLISNPTATNSCPYKLLAPSVTSGTVVGKVTWVHDADNTAFYPLSYATTRGSGPAPTPAACLIAPGVPYCLMVAANSLAWGAYNSTSEVRAAATSVCLP